MEADMKAAKKGIRKAAADRGENIAAMEPLRLAEGSRYRGELGDQMLELATRSAGLRRALPGAIATALAQLVRAMNCYYSNLIEGHDTHPIDIERALQGDYSTDRVKRDLQLEAKAHIAVQEWLDQAGLESPPTSMRGIAAIHERFCALLPEGLLWVTDPVTRERLKVVPGEFRQRDVAVGNHRAVSPGAVPRFLERYEAVYAALGNSESVLSLAAAHHRLLWIHPFLDGNGRVARLISHATVSRALDTGALWSIARGLARNVDEYKRLLAECDLPRRNDLDGRGELSEEALAAFSRFFLRVCIDQVRFMESLIEPERLRSRVLAWAKEEADAGTLPQKSAGVLDALLSRGELTRAEVAERLGASDRHARRVVAALIEQGVVASETTRAPLTLQFPAMLAHRWMPGLFPPA